MLAALGIPAERHIEQLRGKDAAKSELEARAPGEERAGSSRSRRITSWKLALPDREKIETRAREDSNFKPSDP